MGQSRALTRWADTREACYTDALCRMQAYTEARTPGCSDVFWAVEHLPVFTLGVAGLLSHIHDAGDIPVVRTDRGGQVTYHGPGQLVFYTLLDLKRLGLSIRALVTTMEQAVIDMLVSLGLSSAQRLPGAPGVYLPLTAQTGRALGLSPGPEVLKIASLGLKVRRGCCYHGIALNVRLTASGFSRINPCGYPGLLTTDLFCQGIDLKWGQAADMLSLHLDQSLYSDIHAHL